MFFSPSNSRTSLRLLLRCFKLGLSQHKLHKDRVHTFINLRLSSGSDTLSFQPIQSGDDKRRLRRQINGMVPHQEVAVCCVQVEKYTMSLSMAKCQVECTLFVKEAEWHGLPELAFPISSPPFESLCWVPKTGSCQNAGVWFN